MRVNRLARWLATAFLSALLLGCPPEQELALYNNTGEDLRVRVGDDLVPWKSGEAIRFGGDDGLDWKTLSWEASDDGVRDPQLIVEWDGERAVYRLAVPGLTGPFLDRSTGLYRRALQMQPDRKLYAVHVGSELPVEVPPSQPEGLPLVARSSAG
jgi:hypothetical protein